MFTEDQKMVTEDQTPSFYEKTLKKTAHPLKGGRVKHYFYHEAFPNLRFYSHVNNALQNDALQGINAIINLATTDMSDNPLTAAIKTALAIHGKLNVEFVADSTFDAHWEKGKKTIRISNASNAFAPESVIDSFIFELCNATNNKLLNLNYDSCEKSEDYAQLVEEAEADSNNNAADIVLRLGAPSSRKFFDVKEAVELSHSVNAVKVSNGFSHFDRYVNHHNDFWISKIQSQLRLIKFLLIFSCLPTACSKKAKNYYNSLKDMQEKLNAALQERLALCKALSEQAQKNLENSPHTGPELLELLRKQQHEQKQQLQQLQALLQQQECEQKAQLEKFQQRENEQREQLQQLKTYAASVFSANNTPTAETDMLISGYS